MRPATRQITHVGVAAILALGAFIGAAGLQPATAQDLPPSLQGETFWAYHATIESTFECERSGELGTVLLEVEGIATGPYTGTFTERVLVQFGPLQPSNAYSPAGYVAYPTDWDASFTIDSPTGDVTGTKELLLSPFQVYCIEDVLAPTAPSLGRVSIALAFPTVLTYEATIDTAAGRFSDSGRAESRFHLVQAELVDDYGYFTENFVLSTGVLPLDTSGKATGGGQILNVTGNLLDTGVTFGFEAKSAEDRDRLQGRCLVRDHASDVTVKCLDVTSYSQVGNTATFSGPATVNGAATTYRITVQDNADPGAGTDTFSISTDSGYSAAGPLTQGNIQVHLEDVATVP